MVFGDLTIDGLIDTSALSNCIPISKVDFKQIKKISLQQILKEGPPPDFQIMVAKGQLETPLAKTELQFEAGDTTFVVRFIVMSKLANHLFGLLFLQRNGTVLDMRQGIHKFPPFSMLLKNANTSCPKTTEVLFNLHEILFQPGKHSVIWIKSQIYKEHKVTGTLQPSLHIENDEEIFIYPCIIYSRNHHYMLLINNFQDKPQRQLT